MDPLTILSPQTWALIVLALVIFITVTKSVRVVPQSEKYVIERFGRLRAVLGPGHDPYAEAGVFLDRLYTNLLTAPADGPADARR